MILARKVTGTAARRRRSRAIHPPNIVHKPGVAPCEGGTKDNWCDGCDAIEHTHSIWTTHQRTPGQPDTAGFIRPSAHGAHSCSSMQRPARERRCAKLHCRRDVFTRHLTEFADTPGGKTVTEQASVGSGGRTTLPRGREVKPSNKTRAWLWAIKATEGVPRTDAARRTIGGIVVAAWPPNEDLTLIAAVAA